MLLFAYGTLQNPTRRAAVIGRTTPCRIVAEASIRGALYDAGDYPALQPSDVATDRVAGVLLELDDGALARLDDYEGVATGLYRRVRCTVDVASGGAVDAWVYLYTHSVTGLRRIAAWPVDRG